MYLYGGLPIAASTSLATIMALLPFKSPIAHRQEETSPIWITRFSSYTAGTYQQSWAPFCPKWINADLLHRLCMFAGTDTGVLPDLLRINFNQAMRNKRTSARLILEPFLPTAVKSDPFSAKDLGLLATYYLSPDDARMSLTRDTLQAALQNVNSYLGKHSRHPHKWPWANRFIASLAYFVKLQSQHHMRLGLFLLQRLDAITHSFGVGDIDSSG